ncbi:hypothetical protein [Paenibacillus sp. LHD-38]|uniref:hypothetical protein n=1 Tax=Paenibacillus sp. LHD-38 TaxID=3072143 RepID=UPI00280D375E|nr:hypothetical protein [Paenibacillus sp. LHD-38]MDQ8732949.1 hypothetical protein [Paenibacillus sp. LHD-38]
MVHVVTKATVHPVTKAMVHAVTKVTVHPVTKATVHPVTKAMVHPVTKAMVHAVTKATVNMEIAANLAAGCRELFGNLYIPPALHVCCLNSTAILYVLLKNTGTVCARKDSFLIHCRYYEAIVKPAIPW